MGRGNTYGVQASTFAGEVTIDKSLFGYADPQELTNSS